MKSSPLICLLIFIFLNNLQSQSFQHSVVSRSGVVVSVEEHASKAGVAMLRRGGNAIDAAVATAFVLAVTYPQAGNIGGGGFMLIRFANGNAQGIDYRETAPALATADMFLRADGSVDTLLSDYGYRCAGVPGTVRGMETAWKQYGKLPWKDLLEPAIQLADTGYWLTPFHTGQINAYDDALRMFESSRKVFFKPNGERYRPGERFIQKDLARTLRLIAEQGSDAFYKGVIADRLVSEMQAHGGIISKNDLENYRAVFRKPLLGTYRGYEIIGMPPPSSGGITLMIMLNMLENYNLSFEKQKAADTYHLVIETMRRAYYERAKYLGDPDFVAIPADSLLSKTFARLLAGQINPNQASPSRIMNPDVSRYKDYLETTHFSLIDREGNCVSNTYTLEDNFGSKAVVADLGFLLNNEMHDFNIEPNRVNFMGGFGTNPNLIQPGKRMLSSMTPTIVLKDGKPFLITGSPGGRTIINTVLQVLIHTIDHKLTLREAIDHPRLNHNWLPDVVRIESRRWPETLIKNLLSRGHTIRDVVFLGDAHSIWIDPATGLYHGEADSRRMGWAEGY